MADYSFQPQCLEIMNKNIAGKIILPTGAGKSRIEFEYARSKMTRNDDKQQIVIIVAPRIILCQQLIQNFFDYLMNKYGSVEEKFTFVSSGHFPSDLKIGKQSFPGTNTTDVAQIKFDIEEARRLNRDNILFSTYKSFSRCIEGVKAGINKDSEVFLIADEAHYFTRKSSEDKNNSSFDTLKNNLDIFKSRFFFTATPKESNVEDELKSPMNNETVYGPTIFTRQPKDMMAAGIICEPRLHSVGFVEDISEENFSTAAGDFILKAYDKHEEIIRKNCGDANLKDKIGAKVLVAVEGSQQLKMLLNNGFCDKANEKGITVFWTMSHTDIGAGPNSDMWAPLINQLIKPTVNSYTVSV